jgi:hypothetical protein
MSEATPVPRRTAKKAAYKQGAQRKKGQPELPFLLKP